MVPDWSKKSPRSWGTTYTANENGYLLVSTNLDGQWLTILVNGISVSPSSALQSNNSSPVLACVPIAKGDTYCAYGGVYFVMFWIPEK